MLVIDIYYSVYSINFYKKFTLESGIDNFIYSSFYYLVVVVICVSRLSIHLYFFRSECKLYIVSHFYRFIKFYFKSSNFLIFSISIFIIYFSNFSFNEVCLSYKICHKSICRHFIYFIRSSYLKDFPFIHNRYSIRNTQCFLLIMSYKYECYSNFIMYIIQFN